MGTLIDAGEDTLDGRVAESYEAIIVTTDGHVFRLLVVKALEGPESDHWQARKWEDLTETWTEISWLQTPVTWALSQLP